MMTTAEIVRAIHDLDDSGVREIITAVNIIYNMRMGEKLATITAILKAADRVRFIGSDSPILPRGTEGTILKINAKSVSVDFASFGRWRLPAMLLEPVARVLERYI
ncbi:MAG: hypothetical protein PHR77_03275 [Kiritimatiellae bacterium]|nr:hypothetical protein [Kiritimatiellia bacterium]MDD5519579.1 hypothetical protein [Kiritimatiellia bacterium]